MWVGSGVGVGEGSKLEEISKKRFRVSKGKKVMMVWVTVGVMGTES